ncbi:MAG TPA: phage portal protein [Nitrososphaera sp.]|jgi:hypothetical protein|nr:phage portal protein [Nitrososphaera sp.]
MIATPQETPQPLYTITEEDIDRQKQIAANWIAYDGNLPEPLQELPSGVNPNVMSNVIDPAVETLADFLFGKGVDITVEEGVSQEAQDTLDDTWGKNEKKIPLLEDLALNGEMAGRAFLRVVPDEDEGTIRLVVPDPATIFVQTARQDCETVLLYCQEYSVIEPYNGKSERIFYREEIQRTGPDGKPAQKQSKRDTWSIQHWTKIGERGQWQAAGDAIPWPWPFAPLFSCKNLPRPNSFWGKPEVTQRLIGLNQSIDLLQSCINLVQILYGQPILTSSGMGETEIDVKPGKIVGLPPDGKVDAVAITSDQGNALTFFGKLQEQVDIGFSVPAVATGRMMNIPRGAMTGVAMQLEFMPVSMKNDKKRNLYGNLLIEVSEAILALSGFKDSIKVSLGWQSPLPHDPLNDVQAALGKKQIGVSSATLMRELGYDPEEEAELSRQEDMAKMQAYAQGVGLPPNGQAMPPEMAGEQGQQQPGESPFIGRG